MTTGYQAPLHTQIPNLLLDEHIKDMKEAELKVTLAIARKTFGWHKREDTLSLSQLMELTGLSRQGVLNGIEAGLERGTICRREMGQSYLYSIPVNEVDQSTSQRSRPVLVNEVDQLAPKLVNEVDTQKKGIKERKKVKPSASSIDEDFSSTSESGTKDLCIQEPLLIPPPPSPPPPPSAHKALEAAYVAKLAQYEPHTTLNWGKIGQGIKALAAAGWTVAMVEAGMDFLEKESWVKGHVSPQLLGQHAAKIVTKPSHDGTWVVNEEAPEWLKG